MTLKIQGVSVPDSKLAREITELDPTFKRGNFCSVIRGSAWSA